MASDKDSCEDSDVLTLLSGQLGHLKKQYPEFHCREPVRDSDSVSFPDTESLQRAVRG